MPNIKSAIKRVSVIEKKTLRNNMIKSEYKTAIRRFEEALANNDKEKATELFSVATRKIDQACTKGVIVKNTAARKKSNLAKKLNAANA
jgi:small subunit ribosomal protein S20